MDSLYSRVEGEMFTELRKSLIYMIDFICSVVCLENLWINCLLHAPDLDRGKSDENAVT